jgi:predicted RNase H-like HicB family nuclease
MVAEFTAIYEPQANGNYKAYIAEFPEVRSLCRSLEEARSALAKLLACYFEGERGRALTKASPDAHIEPLRIDTALLPPSPNESEGSPPDIVPTLGKRVRIDPIPRKD